MRTVHWLLLVILAAFAIAVACRQQSATDAASMTSATTPVGTVKDLMVGIVDPTSDVLFEAVSTTISVEGIIEKRPRTDEEWALVQHNALMLAESANLLKMRGRRIARPEQANDVSEPGAPELTPAQIQERVDRTWDLWIKHANELQDTASQALKAVNSRDAEGLFNMGEALDRACENCHLEYWYPEEKERIAAAAAAPSARNHEPATPAPSAAPAAANGIIQGRIKMTGPAPANPVIRMGADPMCSKINAGKRPVQEFVLRSPDGGLANAFVDLQGTFPATPMPKEPVVIDQQGCRYFPRVMGARVGQTLAITNSDPLLHNLHSWSNVGTDFNVAQPKAGTVYEVPLKNEEVMMRLKCDVHSWMVAYLGVVSHPYFAVSSESGSFKIVDVPPGKHTIRAWHEQYGPLTQTVEVKPGQTTTVEIGYTGNEKPATAAVRDLILGVGDGQVPLVSARFEAH